MMGGGLASPLKRNIRRFPEDSRAESLSQNLAQNESRVWRA